MDKPVAIQSSNSHRSTSGSWRGRLIATLIVLAVASLVVLLALTPQVKEPLPEIAPTPVNVVVKTITPLPELPDTLTLSAVVEPENVVRVAAEVAGRVERYGVRQRALQWRARDFPAGETIEEGEPIEVGAPLIHLNQDLLQAAFDRAQAQYQYDESEYERITDLFERGVTSKTEFDSARTRREVSRAAFEEAARSLERTTIVSPLAGFLNRLTIEPGEYVSPGDVVAEIVQLDRVKVVVDIPERDVHYMHIGDRAVVLARSPEDIELSGEIRYLSELADDQTRTSRMEISVDNRDHLLRSGQIVRARLTRRVLRDVIMIPLGAVIPLEEGRVVYIVNDSHAERREITLGLIEGRDVQVLSGLQTGDQLITAGHRYVGPGQLVQVIERDGARIEPEPAATQPVESSADDSQPSTSQPVKTDSEQGNNIP